jgi:hypothetical protein
MCEGEVKAIWPSRYINDCVSFGANPYLASISLSATNPLVPRLQQFIVKVLHALIAEPDTSSAASSTTSAAASAASAASASTASSASTSSSAAEPALALGSAFVYRRSSFAFHAEAWHGPAPDHKTAPASVAAATATSSASSASSAASSASASASASSAEASTASSSKEDGVITLCEIASRTGGADVLDQFRELFGIHLHCTNAQAQAEDVFSNAAIYDSQLWTQRTPITHDSIGWCWVYPRSGVLKRIPADCPLSFVLAYQPVAKAGQVSHKTLALLLLLCCVLWG